MKSSLMTIIDSFCKFLFPTASKLCISSFLTLGQPIDFIHKLNKASFTRKNSMSIIFRIMAQLLWGMNRRRKELFMLGMIDINQIEGSLPSGIYE